MLKNEIYLIKFEVRQILLKEIKNAKASYYRCLRILKY